MANGAQVSSISAAPSRGPLNILWGVIATLLSGLYTAILAPIAAIAALMGRSHMVTLLTRLWGQLIINTCGVKVEIVGLENLAGLKSCVLVSNHQSFFDIFAIGAYIPGEPRFVAKKELLKIPLLGFALKHSENIIIDRETGGRAVRHAINVIKSGFLISVFADGHRATDNRVHEFNDGAAWISILGKAPVVPMSISGSGAFFPRRAMVVIPGRKMRMIIGKPISTEGLTSRDRGELTRRLEAEVRATFTEEV
jgi:1-acyl-sn-glycerol-3-phosphate acyltransferase